MRAGIAIGLMTYLAAALYLSGCGVLPGGASLTLENYRIDETKRESVQHRADNKPLWCLFVTCKKAPRHLETEADGEVSGS